MKKLLQSIGSFFASFGTAFVKGDLWVKGSCVIMGLGYAARGQLIKGFLMTALEAMFALYMVLVGVPYLSKFGTLGTVQLERVFNVVTMKNETNDYDNSFLILLFGLLL